MSLRIWICGLALVLVAVAGVALAEGGIPGPNGVINACRKIEGGRLRAVPSVARCRSYERPLRWNVRGPEELATAVAALFAGRRDDARPLADEERCELVSLAGLIARARSSVERDRGHARNRAGSRC